MIFCGDTHSIRPIFTLIDNNKIENEMIIHVGDFGLGFQEVTRDVKNLLLLDEMLLETNNKLYVIRGNHDNPMFWGIPEGLNLPKFHNLVLVQDNTILNIEGKKILFFGGGISIDRAIRMTDNPPTWWRNEEINMIYNVYEPNIDIVVTHTAPNFCEPVDDNNYLVNKYHEIERIHGRDLKAELKVERGKMVQFYDNIMKNSNPTHWFYGHFHNSYKTQKGKTEFIGLNINELKEI